MTFEIEIGETVRTVTVQRKGPVLQVTVDGRAQIVDARRVGDATLSLLLAPGGDAAARSVDVSVVAGRTSGGYDVHGGGRTIPVQVRVAGAYRHQRTVVSAIGSGPQRLVAPMPGKIVRVLVTPGEVVTARQGLVVVEAMKMENELRAARDGQVRAVSVVEGQLVEAGAVLVVIE